MKIFKKFLPSLLAISALVFALAGCSNQAEKPKDPASKTTDLEASETPGQSYPLTVTDSLDREVVIEKPVEKLIVTQPADAEILYELGAKDLIAGRGEYVNYPEDLEEIPMVGSVDTLDLEQIIALEPDLIILDRMDQAEDLVAKFDEAGIAYLATNPVSIEEIYTSIRLLGQISDKNQEADQLIQSMKSTFAEYEKMADEKGEAKTIYYEISPLEYGLWTAGNKTFFNEIGQMLNLENIFPEIDTWAEVSQEEVIARNPDYIITTSMPSGEVDPAEEIKARPGWESIRAVENNDVYAIDNSIMTIPGPRLVEGMKALYEKVYD